MARTPTGTPASSRSTRRRTMLLVTALVVVLAGAAVLYTALTPARSASSAAGAGPAGAPVSFTAATMSGQQVTVPGGKPSVLLFFGVTCGGCGPTATALGRLQRGDAADQAWRRGEPAVELLDAGGHLGRLVAERYDLKAVTRRSGVRAASDCHASVGSSC